MTTSVDNEALFAAADSRHALDVLGRAAPDRIAIYSADGDRTFAEVDANANQLVRALRARGVGAGDGVALLCANRPEFVEATAAAQRAGLRLTTDQLASHRRRSRLHRRRLRSDGVRRRRALRRLPRSARPRSRRGCRRASRSAATSTASSAGTTCSAEHAGDALDDPDARRHDALHVGHDRRPEGRAPDHREPRRRSLLALLIRVRRRRSTCTCAPVRCTTPRRSRSRSRHPLSLGVPIVLMDGWDAGGDARGSSSEHRVTHTHMVPTMFHRLLSLPDDVKAQYDVSSLHLHHPRRGAVPGRREAAADRVARPDRVGVLRGDRRRGHARRVRTSGSTKPGTVGKVEPARPRPHPRRRRRRAARRARSAPST